MSQFQAIIDVFFLLCSDVKIIPATEISKMVDYHSIIADDPSVAVDVVEVASISGTISRKSSLIVTHEETNMSTTRSIKSNKSATRSITNIRYKGRKDVKGIEDNYENIKVETTNDE